MHTLPALRAGALALACVLAPFAHASGTADADLLTGIPRLACEATLCLSSSLRPGECNPSLDHYFGILKYNRHGLDWDATVAARRAFLAQCPAATEPGMADRVAVMYAGKIVETGTVEDIFYRNSHPYTQALLKSLPTVDADKKERLVSIAGTPPDLLNPPKGCGFGRR